VNDWIPEFPYEDDQPSLREQLESEGLPQLLIAEIEAWIRFKAAIVTAIHKIRRIGKGPESDVPF